MIKKYLAVICVVGAMSGAASAEDLSEQKLVSDQQAPNAGEATARAASCLESRPCETSQKDAKARTAMALLFMGIKNNCGQRPCAIRLAASR